MHATMNFFPFTCQSMVVSSSDPIMSFSPAGTPSPPAIGYHHHLPSSDLLLTSRRSHPYPLPMSYHHQPVKNHHLPDLNKAIRPKKSFTIEALLGLNEDSRDFVGALRYEGRRERMRPYAPAPAATPRSALTALIPLSPESSPKKDESKCRSHHLSPTTDESDVESKYSILHHTSPSNPKSTAASGGHKSPPHSTSGKMKRIRTIFTPEQLERLESEFERQQYMVGPERLYLASTLNLSESQVKIWFQNRRIKWRKQHVEMQQARLAQLKEGGDVPLREGDATDPDSDGDQNNRQDLSPLPTWEEYSDDRN